MKLSLKDIKSRLKPVPVPSNPTNPLSTYPDFPSNSYLPSLLPYQVEEGLWYIPNYISSELEARISEEILTQPENKWVPLRGRRLQNWGGVVTSSGLADPVSLPSWLQIFSTRLQNEGIFPLRPNHVLVNDYLPGEGIMPHTDGPAYYPKVAIVSLGSRTAFQFWSLRRVPQMTLLVEPRSLLVFSEAFYTEYLHGIEAKREDQLLTDDCGGVYTDTGGLLSLVKNAEPGNNRGCGETEYQCPRCLGNLQHIGDNVRGRRISMTIRVVPSLDTSKSTSSPPGFTAIY